MGHPTEREPDPAGPAPAEPARAETDPQATAPQQPVPQQPPAQPAAEQPAKEQPAGQQPAKEQPAEQQPAKGQPAEEATEEPDTPYQPRVRLYEQRVIATVPAPPSGPPTQALPAVVPAPGGTPSAPGAPSEPGAPAGAAAPFGAVGAAGGADVPPPADPGSPLDGLTGDGAPSRAPKVALWAGVGLVVVAGLYAGAQWAVAGTVPKGTSVAGVDIGGMDSGAAVAALEDGLGPRAAEPVEVQAGEASSTIDPAEAGLSFDAQATVDGLTGFSLSPVHLWEHLVGADEVPPVVDVSDPTLTSAISGLEDSLKVEPVDGTVGFKGAEAVSTDAVEGSGVLVDQAVDAVADAWLVTSGPVDLPTEVVEPAITQAETDAALEQAQQVVSGPVTVDVGEQSAELSPKALAKATSFKNADGELKARFDGEKLVSDVVDDTDDLLTEPDDAHFVFSGGKPVVEGGEQGTTLDPDDTASAVGKAALSDERTVELKLVEREPERTKEALEGMGVKEVVSEFSTPLTSEPIRTRNLERGAQLVTGTLVAPGETFSLLDTLSPIDESNGFVAAGVVSNGVHTDAVGGGLSQMATTTYNAGYFAGFDDAGHQPHSYWFSRYPAGREATIYVGAIDMKFTNDTPYGAVMQSWVSGGRLHVQIWSTKYYEVQTSAGDKRNVQPATAVHKSGAGCEPYPGGNDGFTITNYRQVFHDGKQVKDESKTWTYKPDNPVVCDKPKADRDADRKPTDGGEKDDAADEAKED